MAAPGADRRLDSVTRWSLGGLAAVYALQLFSPLRLTVDAHALLSMAVSASQGHGYLDDGQSTQFPFGYPFLIRALLACGIASSATLVAVNLAFLALGLWVVRVWAQDDPQPGAAHLPVIAVLASWVVIKHVTLPQSDLVYFGVSLLALHCLVQFGEQTGPHKWWSLALSVCLSSAALACRTVGISLFPVLCAAVLGHRDAVAVRAWLSARRWRLVALAGAGGLLLWAAWLWIRTSEWYAAQFVLGNSYGQTMRATYQGQPVTAVLMTSLRWLAIEFGTLFSNVPRRQIPSLWWFYHIWGGVTWGLVCYGAGLAFRERARLPLVAYCASFSTMVFVWAFHEERLWLPLLPVLVLFLLTAVRDLQRRWPWLRAPMRLWLAAYLALGAGALLYSTRLSLSGREFGERYGDGQTRMTYRYAFGTDAPVDSALVDLGMVANLRVFEPLARPATTGTAGATP